MTYSISPHLTARRDGPEQIGLWSVVRIIVIGRAENKACWSYAPHSLLRFDASTTNGLSEFERRLRVE